MNEAKHTPGPWKLKLSDNATAHITHGISDPDDEIDCPEHLICIMPVEILRSYNSFNNARLIAAAPENLQSNSELAAIVRELCAAYEHPLPEDALARSDAAIAKATGRADSGQAAQRGHK